MTANLSQANSKQKGNETFWLVFSHSQQQIPTREAMESLSWGTQCLWGFHIPAKYIRKMSKPKHPLRQNPEASGPVLAQDPHRWEDITSTIRSSSIEDKRHHLSRCSRTITGPAVASLTLLSPLSMITPKPVPFLGLLWTAFLQFFPAEEEGADIAVFNHLEGAAPRSDEMWSCLSWQTVLPHIHTSAITD